MSEKIYCGNGKVIKGEWGTFDALNLDVDVLLEHSVRAKNGKRYVNVVVSDRRAADNYGNTKNIVISKPPEKKTEVTSSRQSPDRDLVQDDMPF